MKRKILVGICAVVSLIFIALIIRSCLPCEKNRMKKDLDHFVRAVETEDKAEVLKYIDKAYLDQHKMNHDRFVSIMDKWFGQFDEIKVSISGLEISIDSIKGQDYFASCSLGLKVLARYQGDRAIIFGGIIHPNPVRAFFKKTDKHYRVYNAEY